MGSPLTTLFWRLVPHRHLLRISLRDGQRYCGRCDCPVTRVMGHVVRIGGRR